MDSLQNRSGVIEFADTGPSRVQVRIRLISAYNESSKSEGENERSHVSDLFYIREATDADWPACNALSAGAGMDSMPSMDGVTVAVSHADDAVVGFVRVAIGPENGIAHVEPIVVYPTWSGHGVGRALMENALAEYGEIRLVSRGSSTAFYERLGYESVPWELIDRTVTEDCIGCSHWDECKPVPMRKKA